MSHPPRSPDGAAGSRAATVRPTVVLVVENNPISRKTARGALLAEGYALTEAADARTALEAAERSLPDLVLLDLVLPDGDGFEVAKRIRALSGGKDVPIVALSGFLSRLDDLRLAQSDFVGRLVKPLEAVSIVAAARAHVRSAPPAAARASGGDRHVLLVDPVAVRGALLEKRLVETGFRVTRVENVEKAVERAQRAPPDAIFAEVLLQGRDGFRLSADLRQIPALLRVPIVLVSDVFTDDADRRLARRSGADALVVRAKEPAETVQALVAVLAHAAESPPSLATFPADDVLRRMVRHMEGLLEANAGITRRLARDEARGAILLGIAEVLRRTGPSDRMLTDLLRLTCDAAGVSRGAVFLAADGGRLALEAHFGFAEGSVVALADLYGRADVLRAAFDGRRAISVPSVDAGPDSGGRLLADTGLRSMLVVPLVAGEETLGVMVMASEHRDLGDEWVAFGRAMGVEVAQVLALSHAVRSLAAAEQRTWLLLESIPQGVYGLDAEGRLTFENRAGLAMLGYEPEELVGSSAHEIFHPVRADGTRYPVEECPIHGRPSGPEGGRGDLESFRRKDGTTFPVEWTSFPIRTGGADAGTVVTFGDLTQRRKTEQALKESEERLRQSQKMEAIGRLASGIAHDFNNLLTVMTGYGEMLVSDGRDAKHQHFASEIVKASGRASALTRQLLAFSRKQVLKPVALDLNGVVAEMEPMLSRLLGSPVELTTVLATGLKPVLADPGQMEQVLLNLAVNARDAMPRGGKLTITTSNVRLSEARRGRPVDVPPGSYVRLAVCDSGVGMPPEVQEHVFEPFFTTKAKGKGTGLGLATVFGIIEQSGGRLVFESAVNAGTTFEAYLPTVEVPAEARGAPRVDVARPAGGRETILLMEEEEAVRMLARRVLEELGYAVIEARSATEALTIAGRPAPLVDLLVTGYALAEMDGRELAHRAMAARAGLRALVISGGTEVAEDGDQPPLPLLEKPFSPDALARKVRQVLDARRSG